MRFPRVIRITRFINVKLYPNVPVKDTKCIRLPIEHVKGLS